MVGEERLTSRQCNGRVCIFFALGQGRVSARDPSGPFSPVVYAIVSRKAASSFGIKMAAGRAATSVRRQGELEWTM
jgi:hypothetical protein